MQLNFEKLMQCPRVKLTSLLTSLPSGEVGHAKSNILIGTFAL